MNQTSYLLHPSSFSLHPFDWDDLRPRHHDPDHAAMTGEQLGEVQTQEGQQRRVGIAGEVRPRQVTHVLVVIPLAVRMDGVAALVAAQVAVEGRADVVKFVEQGDELVVETLVEKPRQAEGHEVQELVIAKEIALDLIGDAAALACQPAAGEAQWCYPGLQATSAAISRLGDGEEKARNVQVPQSFATSRDVQAQAPDMTAEVERLPRGACDQPGGRCLPDGTGLQGGERLNLPQG